MKEKVNEKPDLTQKCIIKEEDKHLFDNFDNLNNRREIIRKYKDSTSTLSGKNEDGEDIMISISKTGIILITYQNNGWIRKNFYDEDGFISDELFDEKWK